MATKMDTLSKISCCPICGTSDIVDGGLSRKLYKLRRCTVCGHGWITPMPDAAELESIYGKEYFSGAGDSGYMNGYTSTAEKAKPVFSQIIEKINKYKEKTVPNRLLDVGCAYGFFPKFARNEGWVAEGVEISEEAANFAKNKLGVEVFNGTLEEYSEQGDSGLFGALTMLDVLEHLPSPTRAITLTAGLLAVGGVLVVKVPYIESLRVRVEKNNWRQFKPPEHLHYFSRRSIKLLLEKDGFEIVNIQAEGSLGLRQSKRKKSCSAEASERLIKHSMPMLNIRGLLKSVAIPIAKVMGWPDLLLVIAVKKPGAGTAK